MPKNRTLYFGDNLEILREKIPDESFDLIYLIPPYYKEAKASKIEKKSRGLGI